MKRVATVTFHCSYNYGSALQAYALQTFLLKQGFDTQIVDYRSADFDQYRLLPTKLSVRDLKRFVRTTCFLPAYLHRRNSFQTYWKEHFLLTKKTYTKWEDLAELNARFDAFICGSDQIWNLDCTKGVDPGYFLEFVGPEKEKIAYAPSMAKSAFQVDHSERLREALVGFDHLSVREKSSLPVLQQLTDRPVRVTIDPTMLLEPEDFAQKKPDALSDDGDYIFVYMLGNDPELIAYSNRLSEERHLPVFYITEKQSWKIKRKLHGTDVFGATPDEFLYYIAHARYVITTSFHATVFSVLFNTPFCTFHRITTGDRTRELLSRLGLEGRAYSESFDIDAGIDHPYAMKELGKMKKDSIEYLLDALNDVPDEP